MSEEKSEERTLSKNGIKKFILRVDLVTIENLTITKIASKMAKYFDRIEQRQISNFKINFTKAESKVTGQDSFDFVLTFDDKAVSMTFSQIQNAFWIESSQYKNNSLYKELMSKTIDTIKQIGGGIETKRIGLRYINEFPCRNKRSIRGIYGKRVSTVVKTMITEYSQSRVVGVEEYNNDGYKLRLQYGIPNKFYPSVITVFDLILDIDSYIESQCSQEEWEEIITNLNHAAYKKFVQEMNPKYLEVLK